MRRVRVAWLGAAVVAAIVLFVPSCFSGGFTKAAEERGRGERAAEGRDRGERDLEAAPRRNAFPADWDRWSDRQRKDWEVRIERLGPVDFFPEGWRDWDGQRRARWWSCWEKGSDEEGIFAVAIPSSWRGWNQDRRERWWREQVWRHRLGLLLEQESDGLLPWAFPAPLPAGWDRWNSAEKDAWLQSDSPGHWQDGVLLPRNWNDWSEDRRRMWWDDIADRCNFQPGRVFPHGWDQWRSQERDDWWGLMSRSGVGFLASALPDDWDRWRPNQQEQWLRDVLAAKESVARRAHARLRAAIGDVEGAARRGVPAPDAEEMGHMGLLHGLPPEQIRLFGVYVVGRVSVGIRGDDLRREMRGEAERRGREDMDRPESPRGGRDAGGLDRGAGARDEGRGRDDAGGARGAPGGRGR